VSEAERRAGERERERERVREQDESEDYLHNNELAQSRAVIAQQVLSCS